MPISRFFRGTAGPDADTRRAVAKLQAVFPSSSPWLSDLEVVFSVQFEGSTSFETLQVKGETLLGVGAAVSLSDAGLFDVYPLH